MRRLLLVLLTALLGSAAPLAAAAPPERVKLEPAEFTIEGICDFDVEYDEVRVHGNSLVFSDREGDFTKAITAGNFVVTLTNATTGASRTLNISGQFLFTPNPDGSQTLAAHGRNLLFTVAPEPFAVFRVGRAILTIPEDSFDLVLEDVSGKGFDICEALAGPA